MKIDEKYRKQCIPLAFASPFYLSHSLCLHTHLNMFEKGIGAQKIHEKSNKHRDLMFFHTFIIKQKGSIHIIIHIWLLEHVNRQFEHELFERIHGKLSSREMKTETRTAYNVQHTTHNA